MKVGSQSHIQPCHLFHKSNYEMLFGLFLVVVSFVVTESGSPVKTLPGFPGDLPFKLETGYISVGESDDLQYFYYFFESERSPENDPLLLWIRGGPGCSALVSIIKQTGPFISNIPNSTLENPTFKLSPHSLTKVANMIFLDLPAGSGYTYAKSPEGYFTNDTLTTSHVHQFMRKWLMDHPKFAINPFYFCGDSYSGILVPMVMKAIVDGNDGGEEPFINTKGYILGNPLTDKHDAPNSQIEQAYRLALLSNKIYESVKKSCHGEYVNVDPINTLCISNLQVAKKCTERIHSFDILQAECDPLNTTIWSSDVVDVVQTRLECNAAGDYMMAWANRRDVQEALHVSKDFSEMEWMGCNNSLEYDINDKTKAYNANVMSTVPYHQQLSQRNLRALVYSGDHDVVVPYFSSMKWIESINLSVTDYWGPWYVNEQVAGYTKKYSNHDFKLTFATVKGGSHMSAENRPEACYNMFIKWLDNEDL